MPNAVLRRMYGQMVESRLLEERVRGLRAAREMRGQEACRAAVLAGLGEGDLSSDVAGGVASAYLRGAKLEELLAHRVTLSCLLPGIVEARSRFYLSLGAAGALKNMGAGRVLVMFAGAEEARRSLWREVLRLAAAQELPMLFVALPAADGTAGDLAARATALGVPGIPVEGTDAVAIYRVAGECLARARVGGGPALLQCVRFTPVGKGAKKADDPVESLGKVLLAKGLIDREEPSRLAEAFRAQLKNAGLKRRKAVEAVS